MSGIRSRKKTYGHLNTKVITREKRSRRMRTQGLPLTVKETRAFKIGARARKFALEGCVIEGYEILLTAIAESKSEDPDLHILLQAEYDKYERRVAALDEDSV